MKPRPAFLKEVQITFKKRRVKNGAPVDQPITDPAQVFSLFEDLQNETKEKFICIALDVKMKILCFEVVAIGSRSAVYLKPVEVVRTSLPWNPEGFIVVHNHPSGDPTPSDADRDFTEALDKAIRILGCTLFDHVIIGQGCCYSFAQEGLLNPE